MTNKQKYPNPRIMENPSAGSECGGTWYIRLVSEFGKREQYLLKNQQVGPHDYDNPSNTYFPSKEAAETALTNFMNKTKQATLTEIKSQLSEAKKLIGKKIKKLKGTCIGETYEVEEVKVLLEEESYFSKEVKQFLAKNGYIIYLSKDNSNTLYRPDCFRVLNNVEVTNHSGETYTAQDNGKTWRFGCAEISKELIKGLYKTIQLSPKNIGNRCVAKVTIGAADFSLDTLKALVELEEGNK